MNNQIIYPSAETYEAEVLGSDVPVLVDFYADWCGPCQSFAPVLDMIADKYQGKAKVCKINVDQNQQLAITNKVMSIPTLLFVKQGEIVDRVIGGMPEDELAAKLDSMI